MIDTNLSEAADLYAKDPSAFVEDIIGAKPDSWQCKVLDDLAEADKVSVRSGQGVGKTALEAWAMLWFLACRPYARVVATAPTMQQLYDVLWAESSKWLNGSLIASMLQWNKTRISMAGEAERWFATAKTATRPENMQGFHEDHLLFIVDEASGVADPIMEAILGTLTGWDNKLLLCGNPNRTEGVFFDSFGRDRDRYRTHVVSSRDSSRTSKSTIEMLEAKYGKDSDVVRVRIDGQFPKGSIDSFIPLEMVEMAVSARMTDDKDKRVLHVGVDVARYGDDKTVIAVRSGMTVQPLRKYSKKSTMETCGHVLDICRSWLDGEPDDDSGFRRCRVRIDDSGVGGGVTDRLKEVVSEEGLSIEVVPVNNGSSAYDTHYANRGTEIWGNLRELLEQHFSAVLRHSNILSLPDDSELIKQLSTRKYRVNSRGKIELEKKDDMKKRGIGSPDCADAVALVFYNPPVPKLNTGISLYGGI